MKKRIRNEKKRNKQEEIREVVSKRKTRVRKLSEEINLSEGGRQRRGRKKVRKAFARVES